MGIRKYYFRSPTITEFSWLLKSRLTNFSPFSEMKALRAYLRMCPSWVRGHERLGYLAVSQIENVDRVLANRLIATAEMCSTAIETLLDSSIGGQPRYPDSAKILSSNVLFYRKYFAEALSLTEEILAKWQESLDTNLRTRLFEQAGAAALAVGLNEKSDFYLNAIPERLRSLEVQLALERESES